MDRHIQGKKKKKIKYLNTLFKNRQKLLQGLFVNHLLVIAWFTKGDNFFQVFVLPSRVQHSPQRKENTVGLVSYSVIYFNLSYRSRVISKVQYCSTFQNI